MMAMLSDITVLGLTRALAGWSSCRSPGSGTMVLRAGVPATTRSPKARRV